jgi:hypothetical protein
MGIEGRSASSIIHIFSYFHTSMISLIFLDLRYCGFNDFIILQLISRSNIIYIHLYSCTSSPEGLRFHKTQSHFSTFTFFFNIRHPNCLSKNSSISVCFLTVRLGFFHLHFHTPFHCHFYGNINVKRGIVHFMNKSPNLLLIR